LRRARRWHCCCRRARTGRCGGANQEPGITRQQAEEILQELRQIRQLLERQQQQLAGPPVKIKMNLEGAEMLGSKNAPVTMVEFTDYQCPFCQSFHTQTFGELKKNFIDTGKVRFYSRDLPLDSMHPDAMRAAEAGRCAAAQGQFWALRDVMGHHPDKLDLESLLADAEFLKLDVTAFRVCVVSEKYKERNPGRHDGSDAHWGRRHSRLCGRQEHGRRHRGDLVVARSPTALST